MPPTPSDSDRDAPNHLIVSQDGSPFQATFDIVAGVGIIYRMSQVLFATFTNNRMDSHAFTACLLVGRALRWSLQARERLEHAINSGRVISAWNRMLLLGFNWNGPIRELMEHDDGACFVALCSTLCECYEVNVVAKILLCLVHVLLRENPGDPYLQNCSPPSLQGMRTIAERFCGIFATSDFPVRLEEYMSLDGHGVVSGYTRPQPRPYGSHRVSSRGIADPKQIAEGLYELIQLSRDYGNTRGVRLIGGASAVAVAAVGVWLIDLPTEFVQHTADGPEVKNTTCSDGQKARVTVVLSDQPSSEQSLVGSRVVYLPDVTEVIRSPKVNPDPVLVGRLKWEKLLSGAFPGSFKRLMDMYSNFARAAGSAARIFQAIAKAENAVPDYWRSLSRNYFEAGFGAEYVHFATARFPELNQQPQMAKLMREAAHVSFEQARETFEQSMNCIAEVCHCKSCYYSGSPALPKGQAKSPHVTQPKESYCLSVLALTVIRLVRVLAGAEVQGGLLPRRSGMEVLFDQQKIRHSRKRRPGFYNLDFNSLWLHLLLDYLHYDKSAPEYSPLAVVHTLFSGRRRDEDINPEFSAFADQGICCFYKVLLEPSCDVASATAVYVMPGTIEYRDVIYSVVADLGYNPFRLHIKPSRPGDAIPPDTLNLIDHYVPAKMSLLMDEQLVYERNSWLRIGYEILGQHGLLEHLGPAKLAQSLAQGSGIVSCQPDQCDPDSTMAREVAALLKSQPSESRYVKYSYGNSNIYIFRGDIHTTFIVAAGCWGPVFLGDLSCVPCAIRYGVSQSWEKFAVVQMVKAGEGY